MMEKNEEKAHGIGATQIKKSEFRVCIPDLITTYIIYNAAIEVSEMNIIS